MSELQETALLTLLKHLNDLLERIVTIVAVGITLLMVCALVLSAITRYISGTGYDWFIELPPSLIPWLVFPLLGPLLRSGAHIKVELLTNSLTKLQLLILQVLVYTILLLGAGVFLLAGIDAVELFKRLGQLMELEIEVPIWWMYLAFPVGFAIMFSFALELLLKHCVELHKQLMVNK